MSESARSVHSQDHLIKSLPSNSVDIEFFAERFLGEEPLWLVWGGHALIKLHLTSYGWTQRLITPLIGMGLSSI